MEPTKLTPEHQEAIENSRAFAAEHFSEERIRSWCMNQGMPTSVLKAFYASYLGKIGLPEEFGGAKSDFTSQVLVIEELTRAAGTLLPFLSHIMGIRLLQSLGGESHFPLVIDMLETTGETGFSEAISEPSAGSDTFAMQTCVTETDTGLILNGTKTFVSNGQFEPYIMTVAHEPDSTYEDQKLTFWLFPRDLEGISTYPIETIGQNLIPQAMMQFNDVKLQPSYAIGVRGQAYQPMMKIFDIGRIFICATSLGLALAAMGDAVRYASQRKTFGRPICELAQIQEKLTDMEIKIRSMRSIIYQAAHEVDEGLDSRLSVALAKRMVPAAATEVASEALQIHGGLGYTDFSRISRIWRDCRGNQLAQGTDEIMVRIAGKRVMDHYLKSQ